MHSLEHEIVDTEARMAVRTAAMTAVGELVVGRTDGSRPFDDTTVAQRARKAWHAAGLEPITLHEARHTFASVMIAAGVNARALASYMGQLVAKDALTDLTTASQSQEPTSRSRDPAMAQT